MLKGFIQADKCIVKKGDIVNFVGTIDLETGSIELSRVSLEEIDYKSVTGIEINELIDNIKAVKNNYFVVSGYMVTDSDKYKLFESKSSYLKDKNVGTYFYLNWKDKFNYTGNQEVKVKCKILDTYKLNYCELME